MLTRIETAVKTATFEVLTTQNPARWRRYLPAADSVFGSVELAQIVESYKKYAARLLVYQENNNLVVYPLFLRPVSVLPFSDTPHNAWDALSPEYTGPLASDLVRSSVGQHFREAFADYCQDNRVITEFAHLHPWHCFPHALARRGITPDREIVYIDLGWSEQQLWREGFSHSCRKNIKRAQKEAVCVFPAATVEHIRAFHKIYTATMARNNAADSYYFPLDYFLAFFETMPENALFMMAEYQNELVAGTLYLHDDVDIYSYLGGAYKTFQHVRPTNAVIYETIKWGQQMGKKRLILGGGYQPDDGIFRFKATFSPLRANFQTQQVVHREQDYAALCAAWVTHQQRPLNNTDYFPAYRAH